MRVASRIVHHSGIRRIHTAVSVDIGLKSFMSRVYGHMGLGVAGSVGTSLVLAPMCESFDAAMGCLGVGFVASMASVWGINAIAPKYVPILNRGKEIGARAEDTAVRKLSFAGLSLGMGIMISPMTAIAMAVDPAILPASLLISAGIFGGCALVASRATTAGRQAWLQWKAPLAVGLGTLLGTQLIALGSMFFFGPANPFAMMLHNVDIYGGLCLFTLISIYDAHVARDMYENGKPDHLGCATSIYLDVMNILIRVMEAMIKAKQK